MATSSNLSGARWWRANQDRYPNSTSLDDLAPGFREDVQRFLAALREAGAAVQVRSTRRNRLRAHLMHYSWKVAYGEIQPAEVPAIAGIDIEWDHGDDEASRQGAREMVNLFNLAHIASLTSNHIAGKAVDMTVSWKDLLVVRKPAPTQWRIESKPWDGNNRELHELGATVFGVRKLRTDPPHWSVDGR